MPIFAWKAPFVSLIFLKRSLDFPILLFSCISFLWSLRKAFLCLLAIVWNSAFKWVYLSLSHLLFASLLFSVICNISSDKHFAFLHFFFLIMALITASCYKPPSTVLQALWLSDPVPWICLSLPLYNCKGFDLGHTWMVFPTFFNLSLNLTIRSLWSEPQSASSLVFAVCIELLHLWLQRI